MFKLPAFICLWLTLVASGELYAKITLNLPKRGPASDKLQLVLPAKEFLEFSRIPREIRTYISWDKSSAKALHLPPDGAPYVNLKGTLKDNIEISLNDIWVETKNGRFDARLPLKLEPGLFTIKVFHPEQGSYETFRWLYIWKKAPPKLRIKVKDEDSVVEKEEGVSLKLTPIPHVQLYAGANPAAVVDLDEQKNAELSFRVMLPEDSSRQIDSWRFEIRGPGGKIMGGDSKLGTPPPFFDWRAFGARILEAGRHHYRLVVVQGNQTFESPVQEFDAIEGAGLINHRYSPRFGAEPKEELGHLTFADKTKTYSTVFIGGSLPFILWRRLLVRGDFQVSLHNPNPESTLTFTRLGAGLRFNGEGNSGTLGIPYLYQLDLLISQTGYTTYPSAELKRFTQYSLLLEPRFLLWSNQHISAQIEFGTRANFDQNRFAFGLSYDFFIRPWSMRFGLGFSYDMVDFPKNSNLNFHVVRGTTSATFLL